ncbi:hypothetical protein MSBRW_2287 [Methanosarcina barkeri str. Wiesmoor]|uniref:Phospholipase C n=2 Tax=Methanosarcina barkeri TaxID=2208 RepID=A0A0E3QMI5_METBA|nr:hypothetical protein [Methanosarcina barkeri]AKB51540.1 hypothetical protein MSBRW_2287 [Methanosarcina barkeri str. Wiesmoor]
MKRNKIGTGMIVLTMLMVGIMLMPSAMASTEKQQTIQVEDAAQLKIEALEAKIGEKGMQKVADYLALQASLPDVVKCMPFRGLAFAATDPESQAIKMTYIDNFDVSKKEKKRYKAGLQDIWGRYPDQITKDDYAFMSELGPMIEEEALREHSVVGIKWATDNHPDFAYYACDGSAYRNYASSAADDPDDDGFELPLYRYYNHYWDADWNIGGAPGRCDGFAGTAQIWVANGLMADAHHDFGLASHYLSDTGNPFHSSGAVDQIGNFLDNLFNSNNHDLYEGYICDEWNTGSTYEFGEYVSSNTRAITVTDPEQATKDNADFSAQYFDYIWDKINNNPQTFDTDIYVAYYTAQCVRQTAKYNHGLYDYIM